MAFRSLLVVALLLAATWIQAGEYAVPGTTVVLPLLDGMESNPQAHGVVHAEKGIPLISISVIRKLDRDRVFKEPPGYTAAINGVDFDFTESVRDKGERKLGVILAGVKIDGQGLTITGIFEAGNAAEKELVTRTILGTRFGKTVLTSFMEALPISFDLLPDLDLVTMMSGSVILAGKDESFSSAKGMTVTTVRQELAADEKDIVLKTICQQLAEKTFGVKPDDGKLEKTTLGSMSGFRFTVSKSAAGKLPPGVVYAVWKDGITVVVIPARESGAAEMALFTKQVAKLKSSLKLRK
jgi:hypothetical protein